MKKHWEIYFIVFIALAGLLAPMVSSWFMPKADIVVYTQKTCGWCKKAMAYIDEDVRPSNPNIVIQEIADEMSGIVYRVSYADQENQNLEGELARLELHKQDLDDELKVLINVGKEIPQVLFPRRTHP